MIHIAIVEDNPEFAEEIKKYLKRYEAERKEKLEISLFSDGKDIVTDYKGDYDIALMDIKMAFMDGIKTAKKIREVDESVVIIFITNTPQYAMQGYEVEALDYVLKPVSYFTLSQRMDRALERMEQRKRKKYLRISMKGGMRKVDLDTVRYFEVFDHRLFIHLLDEDIEIKGSIKDIENSIHSNQFFRCNKCYLINLEYVDSIHNYDIHIGKDIVRVSRPKKKEFMDMMNNYMNEVSK